jgi:hypothetical protein
MCGVMATLPHCVDGFMISSIILRLSQHFLNVEFELTHPTISSWSLHDGSERRNSDDEAYYVRCEGAEGAKGISWRWEPGEYPNAEIILIWSV